MVKSTGDGVADFYYTKFFNTGTIEVKTGSISILQGSYVQTAGQTVLSGGDFAMVLSANPMTIDGGTLMGVGTISADVANNGGTTAPGLSAGELTVAGNYTQGSNATLDIEIGGSNVGEFDVLTVTGTAVIDGALVIDFVNDYVPNPGESFVVLTASVLDGTFPQVIGPGDPTVSYENNQVTVTLVTAPCAIQQAADADFDCDVDLDDLEILASCLSGPGEDVSVSCLSADVDNDGHVGILDYSRLQRCFGDVDSADCLD